MTPEKVAEVKKVIPVVAVALIIADYARPIYANHRDVFYDRKFLGTPTDMYCNLTPTQRISLAFISVRHFVDYHKPMFDPSIDHFYYKQHALTAHRELVTERDDYYLLRRGWRRINGDDGDTQVEHLPGAEEIDSQQWWDDIKAIPGVGCPNDS